LSQGNSVKIQPVAKAVSLPDGSYALRIGDPQELKAYSREDGIVDFEIVASNGQSMVIYNFNKQLVDTNEQVSLVDLPGAPQASAAEESTQVGGRGASMQMAVKDGIASVNLELGSAAMGKSDDASVHSSIPDNDQDLFRIKKECSTTLVRELGVAPTFSGQVPNFTDGVEGQYSYSNGAETSVAINVSLEMGVYGVSGTSSFGGYTTMKSGGSTKFPEVGDNTFQANFVNFTYGEF
jgi:hypothetical protein